MVGFKQTEIGLIPEDWDVLPMVDVATIKMGHSPKSSFYNDKKIGLPLIQGNADISNRKTIIRNYTSQITKKCKSGDIIMSVRAPVGDIAKAIFEACIGRGVCAITAPNEYLYHYLVFVEPLWKKYSAGSTIDAVTSETVNQKLIPLPPTKAEQIAIAEVLSDTDNLITALEKLIVKKQNIKQGAMQILLTPKEDWEVKKLGEVCDVLDNLRVPLNEGQRTKMKGEIPYCGANGIVDYVNDYVVNDDILLMAEDGGYFDEYQTRPIAYRMSGKCWVNNHAHILKSKKWICQNFIYYSIVHKNILDYINSGTRAKLNKSDLVSIQISLPKTKEEQTRIATILSDMDKEIKGLKTKLEKTKMIKQGMMQELLTGRTRLV